MSAIVVAGMHRTGTSLVASLLEALGVDMGDRMYPPRRANPHGYYEDMDFQELNIAMLEFAGGDWKNPPDPSELRRATRQFDDQIAELIESRDAKPRWGWKDPRNCLFLEAYHRHLRRYKLVRTARDRKDTIRSLENRDGTWGWWELCERYESAVDEFSAKYQIPSHTVSFESLVHEEQARPTVERLADYVGGGDVDLALGRIVYRG